MEDISLEDLSDKDYLINLSERIMHIAVMHGVDQYDSERLIEIALKQKAAKAKKPLAEQPTIERDGKIYYGKMVNYTTGPALSYSSVPDDGKPRRLAKCIKKIIAARARGDIGAGVDWFDGYQARAANINKDFDLIAMDEYLEALTRNREIDAAAYAAEREATYANSPNT